MPDVWCQGVFTEEDDQLLKEAEERAKKGGPGLRADLKEAYLKSAAYAEAEERLQTIIREYRDISERLENEAEPKQKNLGVIQEPVLQPTQEDEVIIQTILHDADKKDFLTRSYPQTNIEEIADFLRRERLVSGRDAKELSSLLADSKRVTKIFQEKRSLGKNILNLKTVGFGNSLIQTDEIRLMVLRIGIPSSWVNEIPVMLYLDRSHQDGHTLAETGFKGGVPTHINVYQQPSATEAKHNILHEYGEVVYALHVERYPDLAYRWKELHEANAGKISGYAIATRPSNSDDDRTHDYFAECFSFYCQAIETATLGDRGDLASFQEVHGTEATLLKELWEN